MMAGKEQVRGQYWEDFGTCEHARSHECGSLRLNRFEIKFKGHMKRSLMILAAMAAAAVLLPAQSANPVSSNMKQSWSSVKTLLNRMAEKMPEDSYGFKPTPEMQPFGQRVSHIAGANLGTCARLQGKQVQVNMQAASRADAMATLKQMNEQCDAVFNGLTSDADLAKMVSAGRGGERPLQVVLEGTLEHSQECYGYMAVYLRLKGIVPPSSDRNEPR
jgi:hypothetical protein